MEVVDVEYIGKEANRWEEQHFLGEMPEAQIEYGRHPERHKKLIAYLKNAADTHGNERVAKEAFLSRQQLHAILNNTAQPKRSTVVRLCRAIANLLRIKRLAA